MWRRRELLPPTRFHTQLHRGHHQNGAGLVEGHGSLYTLCPYDLSLVVEGQYKNPDMTCRTFRVYCRRLYRFYQGRD